MKAFFLTSALMSSVILCAPQALAQLRPQTTPAFDPAYPALDTKQAGAVRHLVKLAMQPETDRSDVDVAVANSFDDEQFQLAFGTYALAVAQSQLTPAYRELYRASIDNSIQKMTHYDVWKRWLHVLDVPAYAKYLDKSKDWRDPVRDKNIMLSGHLLQMIGLYETFYRDRKYDKPGALRFAIPGGDKKVYTYNHDALVKRIQAQFIENQFAGIECEPNLVFSACNQHPVLGLMSYDQVHGTKTADMREAFFKAASDWGMFKKNRRFASPYRVAEKITLQVGSDGWTGLMMHPWKRETIAEIYPIHRDAVLGTILSTDPEVIRTFWASSRSSTGYGFMAAYAAEVGDKGTARKMLDYADVNFRPVWRDGRYYYPRHDVAVDTAPRAVAPVATNAGAIAPGTGGAPAPVDAIAAAAGVRADGELRDDQLGERPVGPLNGNALLSFARINPGAGLWNIYHRLDATYVADGPELIGVAYPQVIVRQAYYDQAQDVLAIGLAPGGQENGRIAFKVKSLKKASNYQVVVDGQTIGALKAGKFIGAAGDVRITSTGQGMVDISLTLGEGKRILLRGQAPKMMAER